MDERYPNTQSCQLRQTPAYTYSREGSTERHPREGTRWLRQISRSVPLLNCYYLIHTSTGTWIPMERSVELARQYRIELLLDPIINYLPGPQSPPLAPKHATNVGSRARKSTAPAAQTLPSTSKVFHPLSSTKHPAKLAAATNAKAEISDGEDASIPSSPSFKSNSSRTPSPIRINARKRKLEDEATIPSSAIDGSISYEDIILDYFISESTQIPALLIHPPSDFNPNMSIDDEGHTAMHWACAMGKVRVVKLLLSAGADIFRVNHSEQTALMRSVMFSNNYDIRKFPQLYELLHRSDRKSVV